MNIFVNVYDVFNVYYRKKLGNSTRNNCMNLSVWICACYPGILKFSSFYITSSIE